MIASVFALFDVKSDTYGVPFFAPSKGVAVRSFTDLVNDQQSTPHRHPNDFKLVQLGTFDDELGLLEATPAVSLGFAADYLRKD